MFAIVRREDDALLGSVGLVLGLPHAHAEVGYWIGRPYWGNGYATEAARAAVRYAFESRGCHRVFAHYMKGNEASGRVLEKIGMMHEGEFSQHVRRDGRFFDIVNFGVLRRDFALQLGVRRPLVHDPYLRLVGSEGAGWENRKHFFNAAAMAMRRILLDKARRKSRVKHGEEHERQAFDMLEIPVLAEFGLEEYEAVDAAINKLTETDARWGEVVHMRLFLGFSVEQTAELLEVSPATVKNDFRFALNWLRTQGGAPTED